MIINSTEQVHNIVIILINFYTKDKATQKTQDEIYDYTNEEIRGKKRESATLFFPFIQAFVIASL